MTSRQNRNKVKQWFITFPHSGEYTPKKFLLSIVTLSCIVSACGCVETHEDGITPHIHVNLNHKYGLTKSQFLNKIKGAFPNDYMRIDIRPTRESVERAREGYLSKEAVDVWYYTNDNVLLEKKIKKKIYSWNSMENTFMGKINVSKTLENWCHDKDFYENLKTNAVWDTNPEYVML